MKKILVLGAGRGTVGLIRAAKELGHRSIVASIEGNYPGFAIADEKVIVNIKDAEAVAKIAGELGVDAVVTAGSDIALPALGLACDRNGLHGPTAAAAQAASDKTLMKAAFEAHGVRTARHIVAYTAEDAVKAPQTLQMPLIVKPVDLGGSRGIRIVFKEEELADAFADTMEATAQDHCIVEEYIDGYEVSATALVAGGRTVFVLPTGDVRYGENDEIPVGHYVPLDCDSDICRQVEEQVRLSVEALDLDDCAVNADLMVMDGKVYVLELTARLGANAIPEITSAYYGRDIHKFIVEIGLGEYGNVYSYDFSDRENKMVFAQMLISENDGVLNKDKVDDDDCDAWFFLKAGDKVRKFRNPGDCIGQVTVVGSTKAECEEHVARILGALDITAN